MRRHRSHDRALVGTVRPGAQRSCLGPGFLPKLADISGTRPPTGLRPRCGARLSAKRTVTDIFVWEFHERGFQQAVRMGRWKAVRLKPGTPLELYDLAADPREERDVAAANADVVARIETYLKTARTESARWPGK